MSKSTSKNRNLNSKTNRRQLSREQYGRLKAELKTPYRGLRQFIYVTFGASGLIGAFVFVAQVAAGHEVTTALPNLALQIGVVALMVWLFRLERGAERKP
jgi:VIT1/CCC1 family predicted Fe2+/Mn2+ transporter